MKTINEMILLLLLVLLTGLARGQETEMERGKVYPGFIITPEGDTIDGHLLNINLWLNQHMTFMYKDPENAEGRVKYKAGEIKAYQVGSRYYESMDYTFAYSTRTQNFILRKVEGPVSLYVWYYDEDRGKLLSPDISLAELAKAYLFDEKDLWSNAFGKRATGEITELTSVKFLMKFARNMSAYVADNPDLAKKVLDKTPGYQGTIGGIEKIIREYNEGKQTN